MATQPPIKLGVEFDNKNNLELFPTVIKESLSYPSQTMSEWMLRTKSLQELLQRFPELVEYLPMVMPYLTKIWPHLPPLLPLLHQLIPHLPQLLPHLPQLLPHLPQLLPYLPDILTIAPHLLPHLPLLAPYVSQMLPFLPQLAPLVPHLLPYLPLLTSHLPVLLQPLPVSLYKLQQLVREATASPLLAPAVPVVHLRQQTASSHVTDRDMSGYCDCLEECHFDTCKLLKMIPEA